MLALPAFSDLARRKSDLTRSYLGAIERLTAVIWPALLLLMVLADPLVRVLLGADWTATIPLVQIISGAMLLNFPPGINYPILMATGAARRVFHLALLQVILSLPVVLIAAQYGVRAIAWSTFAVVGLGVVTSTLAVRKVVPFTLADLARSMRGSLGVTMMTVLPVLAWILPAGGTTGIGPGTLLMLLLAAGGGWVTGGTASDMQSASAEAAVVQALTPLCVVKAEQGPEQIALLKEESSYQRDDFVVDAGWVDNVSEKYRSEVADACGDSIVEGME